MMGDAADKYPDCLWGEVTAKKFLKEYGSMENLSQYRQARER
jgi:5'-3' exonuclease